MKNKKSAFTAKNVAAAAIMALALIVSILTVLRRNGEGSDAVEVFSHAEGKKVTSGYQNDTFYELFGR